MYRKILIFTAVLFVQATIFGQTANEKIIFVVDSIPVVDDP